MNDSNSVRGFVYRKLLKTPVLLTIVLPVYRKLKLILVQYPLFYWFGLLHLIPHNGLNREQRDIPVIVSLTSYGKRLGSVHICIETILRQKVKPDQIILWIAHCDSENIRADVLRRLEAKGVNIRYCDDIKSYKKIVPSIEQCDNSIIVTADDDVFYPKCWLLGLLLAYQRMPDAIHCHFSKIITFNSDFEILSYKQWKNGSSVSGEPGYLVFPVGVGGVLYPPNSLNKRVADKASFMKLCPNNDDLWLKTMSLLNEIKCCQTGCYSHEWIAIPKTQDLALFHKNVESGNNDLQLKAIDEVYDFTSMLLSQSEATGEVKVIL